MSVDSILAIIFAVTTPIFCLLMIFGSEIISYFKSKRQDKLKMKEIDLEIARTYAGVNTDSKIKPQIPDNTSTVAKPKMSLYKIIIPLLSVVVAIVIPLVVKYC